MQTYLARIALDVVHQLGEGPIWDPEEQRLAWVDITGGNVMTGQVVDQGIALVTRTHVDRFASAVVPAQDGSLLVAGATQLFRVQPRGRTVEPILDVLGGSTERRLNDGQCDPAGRFLIGSLSLGESDGHNVLLRVEHDGSITTLDDDLTLSNGLGWSPDGREMYSVDTLSRTVYVRDYEPEGSGVGERHEAFVVNDGYPDGLAVDADGSLWIAVWGRGQLRHYTPDGTLMGWVKVPAVNATSCCFAGPKLDRLVVTSAEEDQTDEQRAEHPEGGRMFFAFVNAKGLPTVPWAGIG